MSLILYHNPRCSKSRAALALLEEKQAKFELFLYLETPPNTDELAKLIKLLDLSSARDMMRKGEAAYKELGLADIDCEASLIAAMCEHPKLIERPILIAQNAAAIGRPTDNLLTLL